MTICRSTSKPRGNSPAKYVQQQALQRVFTILSDHHISIDRFRADSTSYQKEVIKEVQEHCNCFYIRAVRSADMDRPIGALADEEWKSVKICGQAYTWRAILTDDTQTKPVEIVAFYTGAGPADGSLM